MKRIIIWLVLLHLSVLLTSCKAEVNSPKPQAITYWTTSEVKKEYMEQREKCWNSEHPECPISLQTMVFESDQIDARLWTALHAGVIVPGMKSPDLVDIEFQNFDKYVSPTNCLLTTLNTLVERDQRENGGHAEFDSYRYRGFYFGIPYGSDNMVAIYNEKVLGSYGFTSDGVINWSDFNRLGRVIYRQSGSYLVSIDINSYLFFTTLLLQCSEQDGRFLVDDNAYKSALNMAADLYSKSVATLMPGGRVDSRTFIEDFKNGKILCVLVRQSSVAELLKACGNMGDDLVIQKIPRTGEKHEVWLPGYATAIPVTCENTELVKEFLYEAKLSDEGQEQMRIMLNSNFNTGTFESDPLYISDAAELGNYLERYEFDLAAKIFNPEKK